MSLHFSFIVSYGGEVVNGENGAEYVRGSHQLISLDGDLSFDSLCQAISTKIGLKSNEKISKKKYKLSYSTGGSVRYMFLDIVDDGDVQQIVENHVVNT